MKYEDTDIARLVFALNHHYGEQGSYYPVDTQAMNAAITMVTVYGNTRDNSPAGRMSRLITGYDELEVAVQSLVHMATPLINSNAEVHDAIMILNGHDT
jgi:hypothetical protein